MPTGNFQCDDYDRFFIALPTPIIGARIFSCLSVSFQFIIVILVPFGMRCAHVFEQNVHRNQNKVILTCGFLEILSGMLLGSGVSWYAALVVEDYSRYATGLSAGIETTVQRFVYGQALYFGWAAMAVNFVAGVMLCCSSWGDKDEYYDDEEDYTREIQNVAGNSVKDPLMNGTQMVNLNETQPTYISSNQPVLMAQPMMAQPMMQTQFVPVSVAGQAYPPNYAASVAGSRTRYM